MNRFKRFASRVSVLAVLLTVLFLPSVREMRGQTVEGRQGPDAASSQQGLFWVDAEGVLVGPYGTGGPSGNGVGIYVDDEGFAWSFDVEAESFTLTILPDRSRYYLDPSCAGAPYVPVVPPRWPFTVLGLKGGWVRSDHQPSETIQFASRNIGTACLLESGPLRAVPFAGLKSGPANPPVPSFVPPIHIERR